MNKSILSIAPQPKAEISSTEILDKVDSVSAVADPVKVKEKNTKRSSHQRQKKTKFKPRPKPRRTFEELTPEEQAAELERASYIYRATGKVKGEIRIEEAEVSIEIEGQKIPLIFRLSRQKSKLDALKQIVEEKGTNISIIVYPHIAFFDGKYLMRFVYVREAETNTVENSISEIQHLAVNHFILSGIWLGGKDGDNILKIFPNITKYKGWFSRYQTTLRVNWDDCPIKVKPYQKIYLSIEAEFLPETQRFKYLKTLIEPTKNYPRYQLPAGAKKNQNYHSQSQGLSKNQNHQNIPPKIDNLSDGYSPEKLSLPPQIFTVAASTLTHQKYSESQLKICLGFSATSQIKQLKEVNDGDERELFNKQGERVGKFRFTQVGRNKYWEQVDE
jgi:hypothetical protein